MRYARWNMNAGSFYGVKALFADLKLGGALEALESLVCFDGGLTARVKA